MSKDNVVVGFVGLGTMGGRMAANVQRAGFKLVVHDLHRPRCGKRCAKARPGAVLRSML